MERLPGSGEWDPEAVLDAAVQPSLAAGAQALPAAAARGSFPVARRLPFEALLARAEGLHDGAPGAASHPSAPALAFREAHPGLAHGARRSVSLGEPLPGSAPGGAAKSGVRPSSMGHAKRRKLTNRPQDYLDEPEMMFEDTAVGVFSVGEEVEGDIDREELNKQSSNSLKRGSYSSDATSRKNPMVKIMKGMLDTLQSSSAIANMVMQDKLMSESIKEVMTKVVECGAEEGSEEHFVASQIFVKADYRVMFDILSTKEVRLNWLKKWCQMNKRGNDDDDDDETSDSDDEDEAFEIAQHQYVAIACMMAMLEQMGEETGTGSSNATSRKKRVKNPMDKIMKGILDILQSNSPVAYKAMQDKLRSESIKEVMALVVECGAEEGNVEHSMARQLFVKAENRAMFHTITTKEGRLNWLKMWCHGVEASCGALALPNCLGNGNTMMLGRPLAPWKLALPGRLGNTMGTMVKSDDKDETSGSD